MLQSIDRLVQILPRKGESAYAKFVSCLESESEHPAHQELADKLTASHPVQKAATAVKVCMFPVRFSKVALKYPLTFIDVQHCAPFKELPVQMKLFINALQHK